MKTRQGFVSNSSSSSFVVCFDKKPKSLEECRRMLFKYRGVGFFLRGFEASVIDVAKKVWEDLKDQEPMTKEEIRQEFRRGLPIYPHADEIDYIKEHFDKLNPEPNIEEYGDSDGPKSWESYEEAWDKFCRWYADFFIEKVNGREVYKFEYSDCGEGILGIIMEHANIFYNMTHFIINMH